MSLKSLGKQSLIYGLGHIISRLVTFLLLPLYTNVFTTEEYGVVALFYTFLGFMNVIMRYGLGAAFLKYYVPASPNDRNAVLSNVITSLVMTGIPFLIIWHFANELLSPIILGINEPSYISIMGVIIVVDTIWSIPLLGFRAENKPLLFTAYSLLNVGITIALNLFLILKMGLGIKAIFYSNLTASIIVLILCLPFIWKRFVIADISFNLWKKILSFAIPFLPAGLFSMTMELADRYILKMLTDLSTVGIYNAGYKVGMLMMLAVTAFNYGWQPYFLEEGKQGEKNQLFSRVTTFVVAILGFIWLLLVLWADDFIKIKIMGYSFLGEDFQSSLSIVPWIGLGYVFYGFYVLQTPGLFLKNRPGVAAWTRGVGAVTNIILCFLLIPHYGAKGAAVATCFSFMAMFIMIYLMNTKLYPIDLEWSKLTAIGVMMFSGYFASLFLNDHWGVNLMITALYPIVVLSSKLIKIGMVAEMIGDDE